jgi:hypothetical protein
MVEAPEHKGSDGADQQSVCPALKENDYPSQVLLQCFITERVETNACPTLILEQ